MLTDLELLITLKIIRELIYFGVPTDERVFTTLMKIGGSDKVVRHWLRFMKEDHTKIHRHVDAGVIEKEFFVILKNSMVNFLREDTLAELARIP